MLIEDAKKNIADFVTGSAAEREENGKIIFAGLLERLNRERNAGCNQRIFDSGGARFVMQEAGNTLVICASEEQGSNVAATSCSLVNSIAQTLNDLRAFGMCLRKNRTPG